MAKKTKRRIHIPFMKKKNAGGAKNAFRYAAAAMQGWRETMEDTHRVRLALPGQMKDWAFAGVFDGHGGKQVSEYTSKNLLHRILRRLSDETGDVKCQDMSMENKQQRIKEGIAEGFLKLDETMRKTKKIDDQSGTTAVCAFVTQTHFYFANCGDSRAILCRRGKIGFSTTDHKPTLKEEKKRIEAAGGKVQRERVNGCLALSRALGDFEFKSNIHKGQCDQMVSPQPDITVLERSDADEFIVLACDGVFDVMLNCELIAFIRNQMTKTRNLKTICNNTADHCLKKGSRDNISIVILTLPGCPTNEEMLRKRKLDLLQMNQAIRSKKIKNSDEDAAKSNEIPADMSKMNMEETGESAEVIVECACNQRQQQQMQVVDRPDGCRIEQDAQVNRRRNRNIPNAFIIYFLDYWKKHGGNICKTAKRCGEHWSRLGRSMKQKYIRRYLYRKQRHCLKKPASVKNIVEENE